MIVADSGFSIIGVLLNDGTNDPFKSLTGYNVGSQPSGIALGDFNGDAKLDIVVSNQNSNDVTVLINNGAGLFPVSHTLAAGHGPSSIVVMDYNHDGKPDIAVSNSGDNNIMVMLGNGDGTFQPAITLAAGSSPVALAVGNLTGGGFSDLIVANAVGNNVGVLLNTAAVLMQEADAGPTTYGAMAMFTASVTPAVKSNQTPGGSVSFSSCSTMPTASGCPAGASTLATSSVNGQGTATGGTGTLPAGTSFITATYSGNGSFNPGNIVITHTVTQAPTSLALSFSVNPAGFAQTVLLLATATSTTGAAPTGGVIFTDVTGGGNTPLGSGPVTLVSGQAALPISSLTLGNHHIQATYGGDGNFLAATAPAQATVTILPAATSATLSSGRNPSVYGQAITLNAHVTAIAGGTPTGNVTFLDGANALATVATDNAGFAQLTTTALTAGAHSPRSRIPIRTLWEPAQRL